MSGESLTGSASDRQWHQRVWSLSWPIIISNLSVPLAGIVDTAVVGHLPDPSYIGAVAIGALIFSTLYWLFGFLRMSTTGFVAQSAGAGDRNEMRNTVVRAGLLATLIAVILLLSQIAVFRFAFFIMDGSASVEQVAHTYVSIRIWGAPAALYNWVILGCLFGLQRMRAALAVQLALNATNIVLDFVFVVGFDWGVTGVAAATVISEYVSLGLGVWFLCRALGPFDNPIRWPQVFRLYHMANLAQANLNIMLRSVCALGVFFYFTSVSAGFGDIVLAANVILIHFFNFLSYGLDGLANAVEALGGHAFGKRDLQTFRKSVKITSIWAFAFALMFTIFYALFGGLIIEMMTSIEAVRAAAHDYLLWLVMLPMLAVWSFQLDGIFIGSTHTREMRDSMLLSMLIFLVCVWLLTPPFGNTGLWTALFIFMLVRTLSLGLYYPRILRSLGAP